MKQKLVDEVMGEYVNYGGLAATRMQAYRHLIDCGKSRGADEATQVRVADRIAFLYPPIDKSLVVQMVRFDPVLHG